MTFIDIVNDLIGALGDYVEMLFDLTVIGGVSIGSIMLVSLLLWVIVTNFWHRS